MPTQPSPAAPEIVAWHPLCRQRRQDRCHVWNVLPWKLTPPSICNNQLYYKITPRVIVLWLPGHIATTGLHCKLTPILEWLPINNIGVIEHIDHDYIKQV